MSEGLVSVIVPCYNGRQFLAQALRSVLWQTYTNWECLLVDDGSTDGSAGIFRDIAGNDERFRYHRQENSGLSAARNKGLDLARGEFIQFLDDDDIILDNRLERCLEAFHLHPEAGVIYTDYVCYQRGLGFYRTLPGRIPEGDIFLTFLLEQNKSFATIVHSFLFRAEIIRSQRFDTSLRSHAEDVECWIRIAESGARFEYVDEVLAIYRYTTDSLGSDESALLQARVAVLHRYAAHPKVRAHEAWYRQAVNYFNEHHIIGYFKKKDFREGVALMRIQWRDSAGNGKIKMLGWLLLMLFFSKDSVINMRAWIVGNTPFAWGGWQKLQRWTPPESVRKHMFAGE